MSHAIGRPRTAHDVGDVWSVADATELYEIDRWGQGYFTIGDNGQVKIHPTKDPNSSIDLKQLVDDLQLRGIRLPTLIRFRDLLRHRLQDISEAFQRAIAQYEYSGRYVCVYIRSTSGGRWWVLGRAPVGWSRQAQPGLVVAAAPQRTPIICNGFKRRFIGWPCWRRRSAGALSVVEVPSSTWTAGAKFTRTGSTATYLEDRRPVTC
jgi:arginine decarboxylase-like protein